MCLLCMLVSFLDVLKASVTDMSGVCPRQKPACHLMGDVSQYAMSLFVSFYVDSVLLQVDSVRC